MAKVFSRRTLGIFEDASASIPLTQLDRVFEGAGFRLGSDPGGAAGARRVQFRRYVASVDQHDRRQLDRLGDALGMLIEEVATSKQDFLVKAAERDGLVFAAGSFRAAVTKPGSFAVTSVDDLTLIEEHGRRLHLLANDCPKDAIAGANELVESVCRSVLAQNLLPATEKMANLSRIVNAALDALELAPANPKAAKTSAALVRKCLQQLGAIVGELRGLYLPPSGRGGKRHGLSPRHSRLAVAAAVAFAGFVAETHREMRER